MASTSCYWANDGSVAAVTGAHTCGAPNSQGFTQCCGAGSSCHPDGFCHFTYPQANKSGWYLGGCTDPTSEDASCSQSCRDLAVSDVVYNQTSSLWACCGSLSNNNPNVTDCTNPGNITFQAPPPDTLLAEEYSASSTTQPSSSSTALISTSSQNSSSSQSDIGLKAGIGLVTSLLIIVLLFSLGWFIIRRRRNRNHPISGSELEKNGDGRLGIKSTLSEDEELTYGEFRHNHIRTSELESLPKKRQLSELEAVSPIEETPVTEESKV